MEIANFKKIKDYYFQKNVIVTTNDGRTIVGKYDSEMRILNYIYISGQELRVEDIKEISLVTDDKIYKYVTVDFEADNDYGDKEYYYRTTLNKIEVDDEVFVDFGGKKIYGYVTDVCFYTRDTAPYPVEKTKIIDCVTCPARPRDDDEDDYDDDEDEGSRYSKKYVVMKEIATDYPTTEEEMLSITGVGANKLEKHGDIFIKTINDYIEKKNIKESQIIDEPQIDYNDSKIEESITNTNESSNQEIEEDSYDKELFEKLQGLRLELIRQKKVSALVIFNNETLKEMATYYPTNMAEMLKISGLRVWKVKKYKDYIEMFIKTINDYITEHNIKPKEKEVMSKTDTKTITYILYAEGKTVSEIAEIRGLKEETIIKHLLVCYENGLDVDIENYIHTEFENIIYETIEEFGYEREAVLKEKLPKEVTYLDINYYIAKYLKQHKNCSIDGKYSRHLKNYM